MKIFKKIRLYYWLTQEFFKRHYKVILTASIIAVLTLAVVTTFAKLLPNPKIQQRIGRVGKFTIYTLPRDIQEKISLGLTTTGLNGDTQPGLASEWKISEDGKTYSFTLDSSRKWQDNSKIKADSITYDFKEVSQENSENTITFKLQEPFSPFLDVVSKPVFKGKLVGIGEYQVVSNKIKNGYIQSLTLANDESTITYKFYPTEQSIITAYKLGEIDKIEQISYVPEDLIVAKNSTVEKRTEENKFAALFFNNNDSILNNKKVRQALAFAIKDKSFGHEKALSPISKFSWAYNDNVREYAYDQQRAKTLFSEEIKEPETIHLEIKTTLAYLDIADKIAKDWRETLGITVEARVVTNMTDEYQVILVDYAPPKDPDQYPIWHSTQPTNLTHYQNLKIDKLLEDGRKTTDRSQRKQIYEDFQRFLMDDVPALFLFHTSTYEVSRNPLLNF